MACGWQEPSKRRQSESASCSEEALLQFNRGRSWNRWLSLPRRGFSFAASLVSPYCRFQAGFELGRRADYNLEGGRVERPDPHQVLKGELVQAFGHLWRRGDGVFIQKVRDERRDEEGQQLHPCWNTETEQRLRYKKEPNRFYSTMEHQDQINTETDGKPEQGF